MSKEKTAKTAQIDRTAEGGVMVEMPSVHKDVIKFIQSSVQLRPETLIISDIKWKALIRQVLRGKNILMTGPSGCGKTMTAFAVAEALGRPKFVFNLGSTSDPKAELLGNTHFDKDAGTFFDPSDFIKAITTPYAVVVLDEITRAHPDAWNILMSVLDYKQRYVRLSDERTDGTKETRDLSVAEGVSFISTANIGTEYTATRVIDRALLDRFVIQEMDVLDQDQEAKLLKLLYPDLKDTIIDAISDIADSTRAAVKRDDEKALSTIMSTRMSIEMAGMMYDGFGLKDSAEICILPFYKTDEERRQIMLMVQKYHLDEAEDFKFDGNDLFSEEEIEEISNM